MDSRSTYPLLLLPFLALALVGVLGLLAAMAPSVLQGSPSIAGGAAQIADTATPAEQYASVTSAARPLSDSEEARKLPQGQPETQPQGSPATAPQRYPANGVR